MDAPEKLVNALAGRYRLERELGRGGMATVYLAEDVRHRRHVAVKVLHPELSAVIGPERFLKEIELTAGLQHPHILPLFDSGSVEGLLYYVMPYVEGETLRARLDRERQLPVSDAVRIAAEIASALEYAHSRHIVHRDIKPENILLQANSALVADFGIALAVQTAGGERMTQTGLSLGTPQYMAPEQAMGERNVDHRADIYALGAVTYEMLAGQPPFTGPSAQSIIAKVMTESPPALSDLRKSVSPTVAEAVHRALEKLPADRWSSAQAFANALSTTDGRAAVPRVGRIPGSRRQTAAAIGVAVVASVLALWGWTRPAPEAMGAPPSRLSIVVPGGTSFPGGARLLDMSADGSRIVYYSSSAAGGSISMLHDMDGLESVPIKGAQNVVDLHLSPDGRELYFGDAGQGRLSRINLNGGAPIVVDGAPSSPFLAFAPDGSKWISTTVGGLLYVSPDGKAERRFTGDTLARPMAILQVLPDGKRALVKEIQQNDGILSVMDLRSGTLTRVLDFPIAEARYFSGYLVLVRDDGRLSAMPFDMKTLEATGVAVQLADDVALSGSGIAQFAVASNGTIAYVPAQPRELMLVDRSGNARPLTGERRSFHQPRFSRDGTSILVDYVTLDGRDVWKMTRSDGAFTRVTSDRDGHDPNWSPDGRWILYASSRSGKYGIYRTRPGSGSTELLIASDKLSWPGQWLPDGKSILAIASELQPGSGGDIVIIDSTGTMKPLVATSAVEAWADVSPDGAWIAFTSDRSGANEVYVRAMTANADQVQVSLSGGSEAMWSRDGRELFYRASSGGHTVMTVATLATAPELAVLSRKALFQADDYDNAEPHSNYDVSPDGQSFVMVRRGTTGRIVVIQNLPALVRKLQGAGQSSR